MFVETSQNSNERSGNLSGCLVEGDAEQRVRQRRVRRRSLAVSIGVQSAIFVAIILLPLFARPERIALANYVPIPPYSPYHPDSGTATQIQRTRHFEDIYLSVPVARIPDHPQSQDSTPEAPDNPFGNDSPPGSVPGGSNVIGSSGDRRGPERPHEEQLQPRAPMRVHTQLDPATLMHRVEPAFPPLARQIGRGGKVELRAIIAIDGTIQSLEVVSGDPLFYQSALDAVRQWRYRPTYLNGQPVEVDTFISVVYVINR